VVCVIFFCESGLALALELALARARMSKSGRSHISGSDRDTIAGIGSSCPCHSEPYRDTSSLARILGSDRDTSSLARIPGSDRHSRRDRIGSLETIPGIIPGSDPDERAEPIQVCEQATRCPDPIPVCELATRCLYRVPSGTDNSNRSRR
jgi:hypothetical protein